MRCPSQYWRVGSSPISRTGVKDIRFFECPLFLYLGKSANPQITIILKSTLESHEIFDFVEAELVPQREIFDFAEVELVPQADRQV